MNRRKFLQTGLASSLLLGSSSLLASGAAGKKASAKGGKAKARNVIFLVSDGLSSGTLSFVDQFVRWRDKRSSHWVKLYEEEKVRHGLMDTASADSIVTCSAAAAAAWGCGHRVNNGSLNISPEGKHHPTILQLAREAGKATGVVTTATVTHATPAGFAANVSSRNEQPLIAEQYFDRRLDLILGGGFPFFDGERREDGRDLIGDFTAEGYGFARNRQELEALRGSDEPLLGLLTEGHLPYELDRLNDEKLKKDVPSLAELTDFALERLNRREEGFVVQIEGARVDHAAHANDIGGLLYDQIAFDDAIKVAVDFAEKHGDTLVIITTDHGNANPGLNSGLERNFTALAGFTATNGAIFEKIGPESSTEEIIEAIQGATGLEVPAEEAQLLRDHLRENYRLPYGRLNRPGGVLGQIIANHTDIGWVGTSHTSDHVQVVAMGPGSEMLRSFQKNTHLFTMMTESLAIGKQAAAAGI